MHNSAMLRMKWFVDNYIPKTTKVKVLDIGSYSVNGNYRDLFKGTQVEYVGLDIEKGPNVDIVVKDPYFWTELEDESFDFVISGNAFEHIEFPWCTIEEIYRKLKPEGIICLLAPFCLSEHKYPTDCYRYYPDGFKALAKWAGFEVIDATTGGVPKDANMAQWSRENYDDTMLVAIKTDDDIDVNEFPRFDHEVRSNIIVQTK